MLTKKEAEEDSKIRALDDRIYSHEKLCGYDTAGSFANRENNVCEICQSDKILYNTHEFYAECEDCGHAVTYIQEKDTPV